MAELGQVVKDTITGLQGVVVAKTTWLHGCVRLTIQPREIKDGRPVDSYTFDEPQAVVVEDTPEGAVKPRAGHRPEPARQAGPSRS